jgi:integrase
VRSERRVRMAISSPSTIWNDRIPHFAEFQTAHSGRITAPGSSWLQSTRIVQRKRRPTSNVDSMIVLRARRGDKVDTRVVQAVLSHQNIATTAIYTHLTEPTRVSLRKLLDKVMSGF